MSYSQTLKLLREAYRLTEHLIKSQSDIQLALTLPLKKDCSSLVKDLAIFDRCCEMWRAAVTSELIRQLRLSNLPLVNGENSVTNEICTSLIKVISEPFWDLPGFIPTPIKAFNTAGNWLAFEEVAERSIEDIGCWVETGGPLPTARYLQDVELSRWGVKLQLPSDLAELNVPETLFATLRRNAHEIRDKIKLNAVPNHDFQRVRQEFDATIRLYSQETVRAHNLKYIYATNHPDQDSRDLAVEINRQLESGVKASLSSIAKAYFHYKTPKEAKIILHRINTMENRKRNKADDS